MNAARCRGCNERLDATHQPGCNIDGIELRGAVAYSDTDRYLDPGYTEPTPLDLLGDAAPPEPELEPTGEQLPLDFAI